jgi:hypothetical protein
LQIAGFTPQSLADRQILNLQSEIKNLEIAFGRPGGLGGEYCLIQLARGGSYAS